jgi:hypothetical protein
MDRFVRRIAWAEQLTCCRHTHARLILTFDAREQPAMASPRTDSVALSISIYHISRDSSVRDISQRVNACNNMSTFAESSERVKV